jgi:hypothetical protein
MKLFSRRWLSVALVLLLFVSGVFYLRSEPLNENTFKPLWKDWRPEKETKQAPAFSTKSEGEFLLSFIMANRNDGYGGESSVQRVSNTFRAIDHFAGKYNVSLELIIVEWNPPNEHPGIETITPKLQNVAVVRIIKVLFFFCCFVWFGILFVCLLLLFFFFSFLFC